MSYKSETLSITWNRVWMSFGAKSIVQRHGTCLKKTVKLKNILALGFAVDNFSKLLVLSTLSAVSATEA